MRQVMGWLTGMLLLAGCMVHEPDADTVYYAPDGSPFALAAGTTGPRWVWGMGDRLYETPLLADPRVVGVWREENLPVLVVNRDNTLTVLRAAGYMPATYRWMGGDLLPVEFADGESELLLFVFAPGQDRVAGAVWTSDTTQEFFLVDKAGPDWQRI